MAWRYCKEARKKKHLDDQVGGGLRITFIAYRSEKKQELSLASPKLSHSLVTHVTSPGIATIFHTCGIPKIKQ
jgi:hypothetical protein